MDNVLITIGFFKHSLKIWEQKKEMLAGVKSGSQCRGWVTGRSPLPVLGWPLQASLLLDMALQLLQLRGQDQQGASPNAASQTLKLLQACGHSRFFLVAFTSGTPQGCSDLTFSDTSSECWWHHGPRLETLTPTTAWCCGTHLLWPVMGMTEAWGSKLPVFLTLSCLLVLRAPKWDLNLQIARHLLVPNPKHPRPPRSPGPLSPYEKAKGACFLCVSWYRCGGGGSELRGPSL